MLDVYKRQTKVIPARLFGVKEETNGHVEVLLLKDQGNDVWECLVGNARIVKLDTIITFGDGLLKAKCLEIKDEGIRVFKMIYDGIFYEILDQLGDVYKRPIHLLHKHHLSFHLEYFGILVILLHFQ